MRSIGKVISGVRHLSDHWRILNETPITVDLLLVAGGGGGGSDMGGGGGGGGVLKEMGVSIAKGIAIPVVVGVGGAGCPAANGGHPTGYASNGGNTSFGDIVAIGGGAGGTSHYTLGQTYADGIPKWHGRSGGSGGGSGGYNSPNWAQNNCQNPGMGIAGQGNRGGMGGSQYYSGGGGGAGARGADANNQANGGAGIQHLEFSNFYWGGGGGGAAYSLGTGGHGGIGGGGGGAVGTTTGGAGINNGSPGGGGAANSHANTPGGNGGANTGGGGGGGAHYQYTNKGGDGGSGICFVRILSADAGSVVTTGTVTKTVSGSYTLFMFTTSGTFKA